MAPGTATVIPAHVPVARADEMTMVPEPTTAPKDAAVQVVVSEDASTTPVPRRTPTDTSDGVPVTVPAPVTQSTADAAPAEPSPPIPARSGKRLPLLVAAMAAVALAIAGFVGLCNRSPTGRQAGIAPLDAQVERADRPDLDAAASPPPSSAADALVAVVQHDAGVSPPDARIDKARPKRGSGLLRVYLLPNGRARIRGRFYDAPVIDIRLPVGRHRILLVGPDEQKLTKSVTVRRGKRATIKHTFE